MRFWKEIVIGLLGVFVLWRGVLPALTSLDTDFPNYYTAARLFLDGKDMSRLYDDSWFQNEIVSYHINQGGKFSPFPPVTVFLMLPFASFSPLDALRAWTITNLCLCVAVVLLLVRISERDWRWATLLLLGTGLALGNDFRFGQWYLPLVVLMLAGYYLLEKQQPIIAAALFGIGAAFKYFPIVFLPLFVMRRQWQAAGVFVATVSSIYALGATVLGIHTYGDFVSRVFLDHLSGNIQNPFSATFQSWNSLLRRLFIFDPLWNPTPAYKSEFLFHVCLYGIYAGVAATSFWVLSVARRANDYRVLGAQVSLVTLAGMLLLPASATYHFLILILPVSLLLLMKPRWNRWQKTLSASYFLIAFLPYRYFRIFDGSHWLTLLAYPRLWLMTVMFTVACVLILKDANKNLHPARSEV